MTQFPIKRFGDIAQFVNGNAFKPEDWGTSGLPIIRIQNLTGSSNDFNYFDGKFDERYLVKNDDLLISWSASLGVYRWKGNNAVLNQHIFKVNLRNGIDKTFFFFATQTKLKEMIGETHGSTMKHITKDRFEALSFALPPLPIQKQIASILEKADAARQKRRQANQLTEQFLQSAFLEMFGDPVTNPKGWKILNAGDYCEKLTVGVVIRPSSYYVEKGVTALRSLNIRPNRIDLSDVVYFSEEAHRNQLSKSILKAGDVVLVRTGSTGTAAIIPKELDECNCIDLVITRPKRDLIHPAYLCYFFNSEFGKKLVSSKEVGGIQKHFNIGALKILNIPVPALPVQQKFAVLLEKVESLKAKQRESEKELENLFNSLMQRAFKGELEFSVPSN
jgi:type I restriction enzyme S subunit